MKTALIDTLRHTASRLGCSPRWLEEESVPEFNVEEQGESPPEIILLHGLLGAVSNWDALFPYLVKFTRPRALRLPVLSGHSSEVGVKSLAVYAEAFLRSQCDVPAILCGNSLGGHIALRLCLASPELVDCLILTGSSGLYEHSVDALPVRPSRSFIKEHMSDVFFNQSFVTDEAVDEICSILRSKRNMLNLIQSARSAKRDNLEALLGQIQVPTLLLWGEDDKVTSMEVAEQFHKLIPNSTLLSIPGCGHAPMIEHPQWFAEHVERFVKEHSGFYRQRRNDGKSNS